MDQCSPQKLVTAAYTYKHVDWVPCLQSQQFLLPLPYKEWAYHENSLAACLPSSKYKTWHKVWPQIINPLCNALWN